MNTEKYISDYVAKMLQSLERNGSLIIGYDFDDTVHASHEFSEDYVEEVRQLIRDLNATGKCRFILITCRENPTNQQIEDHDYAKMDYVEKFLFNHKLPYNAINQNLPWGIPDDPRKIYCNIMLDDKCGLPLSVEILNQLLKILRNES